MTRYSRSAWEAMSAASWIINLVRVSRAPYARTSSKAKLSKVSMSSGSVTARVETCPGNSSLWFCCARSLGFMVASPLIAVSQDGDGRNGAVNLPQIAFGEIDLDRADVLLQALDLAAARNRNDPRLLSEQPGERDLRRRRLFLLSDPGEQVDNGLIGFDCLGREARVAAANVREVEGRVFVDLARQIAPA